MTQAPRLDRTVIDFNSPRCDMPGPVSLLKKEGEGGKEQVTRWEESRPSVSRHVLFDANTWPTS